MFWNAMAQVQDEIRSFRKPWSRGLRVDAPWLRPRRAPGLRRLDNYRRAPFRSSCSSREAASLRYERFLRGRGLWDSRGERGRIRQELGAARRRGRRRGHRRLLGSCVTLVLRGQGKLGHGAPPPPPHPPNPRSATGTKQLFSPHAQALSTYRASGGDAVVEINWRPFFIDQSTAPDGEDYKALIPLQRNVSIFGQHPMCTLGVLGMRWLSDVNCTEYFLGGGSFAFGFVKSCSTHQSRDFVNKLYVDNQ